MDSTSRRPDGDPKMRRKHAQRVGSAVLAWNQLHADLYMIFWNIVGLNGHPVDAQVAQALWHTIQSDFTQRQMLANAAKVHLGDNDQTLERLLWVIKQTDRLSAYRNIAAHTAINASKVISPQVRADPWSSRDAVRQRFALIDHDRFWKQLAGDLYALAHYVEWLADALWRPGRGPSSLRKPQLQCLGEIHRLETHLNAQKPNPNSTHPSGSSRAKAKKGKKPTK